MKQLPMTAENLVAFIEGRKTVTRRLSGTKEINIDPAAWKLLEWKFQKRGEFITGWCFERNDGVQKVVKPRYHEGETVYIPETWAVNPSYDELPPRDIPRSAVVMYLNDRYNPVLIGRKRCPRFMPAWMARRFATIVSAGIERLQEITDMDAIAEGIIFAGSCYWTAEDGIAFNTAREAFFYLWDSINPKYPRSLNPWVVRYEIKKPEVEL